MDNICVCAIRMCEWEYEVDCSWTAADVWNGVKVEVKIMMSQMSIMPLGGENGWN